MKELLGKDNRSYFMGFSILWIIGLHFYMYSAFPENSIWGFLFAKGYLGVDVFLFLSAYGLCFSFNKNSLSEFYKRRISRLFPLYLLFLIITLWIYGSTYSESTWQLLLYQCTGVASFRQTDFEWYVPALIVLYASFPIIYKIISFLYERYRYAAVLLPMLLSLFSPLLSNFIFPMFASRFSIIALGVITYLALNDNNDAFLYKTYAFCALYAIVTKRVSGFDYSLLIPGVLCLFSLTELRLPLKKEISFLGKHSLEIYLAQSLALNQFFLKSDLTYVFKCLISVGIIVSGALLLYLFQELTTGRLCRKWNHSST